MTITQNYWKGNWSVRRIYTLQLSLICFFLVLIIIGGDFSRITLFHLEFPLSNSVTNSPSGKKSEFSLTGEHSVSNEYSKALLPVPQKVSFSSQTFLLTEDWSVDKGNVTANDPAISSLLKSLNARNFRISKSLKNSSTNTIKLTIRDGSVPIGQTTDTNKVALQTQAYSLKLNHKQISITANAAQGLYYGVQTLLQLINSQKEKIILPEGEIVDWPDLNVRMIYWDDAHHLEHLDVLKQAIVQASYFKVNAFSLKLEGHFQFQSAKPIVEPYALTAAEYQELTDYAKAHYVDLVPYLDAPGHVAFILKHPEYDYLRAFPKSNYEFSVTNPQTDTLLLRMFGELMDANKGGKYILLSTDEAYYVGKAKDDKKEAEALGGRGKLLAKFTGRIADELHKRGRQVIFWGEYPLTPSDIPTLPSHLINGVYDSSTAAIFRQHGMRQFIYTFTQAEEPLFPSYYPTSSGDTVSDASKDRATGRVEGILNTISSALSEHKSDFMGVFIAGWADAGLHPETFWLGYATGAAGGWNHQGVSAGDLKTRFYNSFYGPGKVEMEKVYKLLSRQGQFYDESWEWVPSNLRAPIFGNHAEIYETPKPANDQTLPMLPIPNPDNWRVSSDWTKKNQHRLESAKIYLKENHELAELLHKNIQSAQNQKYNLEVMLSVALLCRQNLTMLLDLHHIDSLLNVSSKIASKRPSIALSLTDKALDRVETMRSQRNEVLQSVVKTWYKQWYPQVEEANGRRFLNVVDDVKDHRPARTVDMTYLIYRELHYPLGKWAEDVKNARNKYAAKNKLLLREKEIMWEKVN